MDVVLTLCASWEYYLTPFTLKELQSGLSETKPCKAFGPDHIPPIIWKDDNFHNLLLECCNITVRFTNRNH